MSYHISETQEHFLGLPKEDRVFLRDHKHHVEAIKMHIDHILLQNHPKAQVLLQWVNTNNNHKKWYLKNINKIKLVPEGIEMFGNIYDIEDIIKPEAYISSSMDPLRWQREDAEKYACEIGKEIPDWVRLVQLFPSDIWQSFFTDVMGMSRLYFSTSSRAISTSKDTLTLGSALSKMGRLRCVTVKN